MPVPRFGVAIHERRVTRLQVDEPERTPGGRQSTARAHDRRGRVAASDIEDQRDVAVPLVVAGAELQEAVEELRRQVIDAVVAQVFEDLGRLALPGTGEPADDEHGAGGRCRVRWTLR